MIPIRNIYYMLAYAFQVLHEQGYIDDFYSGNTEDIKQGALFKEMYRYIDNAVRLNIFEMFDEAIRTTRIEMSSAEKQQFISQYVKTMQMRITDSGDVVLEFKRK